MEQNSILKYEKLLSPFGKQVLQNVVKHAARDINRNTPGLQQNLAVSQYRQRQPKNMSYFKNTINPNNENTFDSPLNVNNSMKLPPIYQNDENILIDLNKEKSDKTKNFIDRIDEEVIQTDDAIIKEINQNKFKGQSNSITWDNMIDNDILKLTDFELSNNVMDVDTEIYLNINSSLSNGGENGSYKGFEKDNDINQTFDSLVMDFGPLNDLNARQVGESEYFRDRNIFNEEKTSLNNASINLVSLDESAIEFNAINIPNESEAISSVDNDDRMLIHALGHKSPVKINEDITNNNWNNNANIKPQPKRVKQTKITDVMTKKVKCDNITEKNIFRKVKYTKTIKNWLNDVNINNARKQGLSENSESTVKGNNKVEITGSNGGMRKGRKKKVQLQTQLANKDGVMKFK